MSELATYRGASADAIGFHYDLGNDFYRLWLDAGMSYSSGVYGDGIDFQDLDGAQRCKLDHHLAFVAQRPAQRILDIGCGWGAALQRARDSFGFAELTGLSLSREQLAYCRHRLSDADLRFENWFDHRPSAPYDAIVSIEAFEAFVRPGLSRDEKIAAYSVFFERCGQWLRPGGRLSLQVITFGTMHHADIHPLIDARIFPESDLPYLEELVGSASAGFEIVSIQNYRRDYVRTLKSWARNLLRCREAAEALVPTGKVQDYLDYLRHSQAAFATGGLRLFTIQLQKAGVPQ